MLLTFTTQSRLARQPVLGQIEHRLDATADVHQAECEVANVALVHVRGEVALERQQRHERKVVADYDGQDDDDHLEGSLLDGVHLVASRPGLTQRPQDGDVAKHHESEHGEQHGRVDEGLEVHNGPHALGGGVGQCDDPHRSDQDGPVLAVLKLMNKWMDK